jgi:hypothetical protein
MKLTRRRSMASVAAGTLLGAVIGALYAAGHPGQGIRVLEFYRAGEIYRQAETAKPVLKRELEKRVSF